MAYIREILYLLGDRRSKLLWLVGLFFVSSLLDLIGLGLIAPYMMLILGQELDGIKFAETLWVFSRSLSANGPIVVFSVVLFGVFLLKAVSAILINMKIINFGWGVKVDLVSSLMKSYGKLSYTEFLSRNSSEYIVTMRSFSGQYVNVLHSFLRLLSEGIAAVIILILLAIMNGPALFLLVFLLGGMSLLYDRAFRSRIKECGRKTNECSIRMHHVINEIIEGLKEVRILGRESYFRQAVEASARQEAHYNSRAQIIKTAPRYLLELMLVTFIVLLVLGTFWVGYSVEMLVPTLSMFGVAAMRLAPSVIALIHGFSQMRFGRHAISRLYSDLKTTEKNQQASEYDVELPSTPKSFRALKLNNLSFRYPDRSLDALKDVSLEIREGESIGLIGGSGSGKTTLVDAMLGFLEPTQGNILFNNLPLEGNLADWRANVAYLPQEVFLIDSTLRCNVALGVPENEIDRQRLDNSLSQARLAGLVSELPDGIETKIGERGTLLSGGQRQRIALARAFYHSRNVLIMDEATSALDNETEREIVEEIKLFKGRRTLIVIAHRLTTVQHCDRIYRMEHGEIVEQGSYAAVTKNILS